MRFTQGIRLPARSARQELAANAHRLWKTCVVPLRAVFLSMIGAAALTAPAALAQVPADTLFMRSAVENVDGTVTLPLFRGSSGGQTVYYIITETSDAALSNALGVNFAPALAEAQNSAAVQFVGSNSTANFAFPATVTFNTRPDPNTPAISPADGSLEPIPTGTPPARGNAGYSPLVQLPNGIIVNAPHIQNNSGRHPRSVSVNTSTLRVVYDETDGFEGNQPVRYISTDASTEFLAAAENVIFAPALGNIRGPATAGLALLDDGQVGRNNIQRQGFDSAVADRLDPLNVLEFNPFEAGYSPIWETEPHRWAPGLNDGIRNIRQRDYDVVEEKEAAGQLLSPVEDPNAPEKVVNCPIISRRSDSVPPSFTPVLASLNPGSQLELYRSTRSPELLVTEPDGFEVFPDGTESTTPVATITNVEIRIVSQTGTAANGVLVAVTENPANGTRQCTTGSNGICSVSIFKNIADPVVTIQVVALNRVASFVRHTNKIEIN